MLAVKMAVVTGDFGRAGKDTGGKGKDRETDIEKAHRLCHPSIKKKLKK